MMPGRVSSNWCIDGRLDGKHLHGGWTMSQLDQWAVSGRDAMSIELLRDTDLVTCPGARFQKASYDNQARYYRAFVILTIEV